MITHLTINLFIMLIFVFSTKKCFIPMNKEKEFLAELRRGKRVKIISNIRMSQEAWELLDKVALIRSRDTNEMARIIIEVFLSKVDTENWDWPDSKSY